MESARVRKAYLDFFSSREHVLRPSAPLIPQGDATLMFNSAGMVPFKPYFLGQKKDLKRATSCQKCFRTTDIERVGTTLRHLTFFEMLGNFSFGDYFKQDAIAWAWEFLTEEMGFDAKRLHPTVFKEDDEAEALWKKQSIKNPVVRLGEDSNFWAAGPTGPCGPCSEIYFDRGPQFACERPACGVGCDCDRYLEIWNLVFMQFKRGEDGKLEPLPRQNIDTGMGLERLLLTVEGKAAPFDTDLFTPIVTTAAHILSVDPRKDAQTELAFRVIADHSRAAAMLMAEGVIPSNVDRGYVLRRLIRRALRYGQLLGHNEPFLHRLTDSVKEIFRDAYPETVAALPSIKETLKAEEEKFLETLSTGEAQLKKLLEHAGKTLLGEEAFSLYETYGFPLELTKEICAQKGIAVDEPGFKAAAESAAETARASWKGSGEKSFAEMGLKLEPTNFTGYTSLEERTMVLDLHFNGKEGVLTLDRTPFYAEGGGQVGDQGWILSADGKRTLAEVYDTVKQGKTHLHFIRNISEEFFSAPALVNVTAKVDAARRARIRPHHTATHLMNEALKRVLGGHIRQAGSYVGPDKLRFDFTHPKALTPEELAKIEKIVNDEIAAAHDVTPKEMPVARVAEFGATTLLGEDYGANPRFLLINAKGWDAPKDRFSLELCGGTHVANTREIKAFKIVKESSAAAGVRRIEAVAGDAVAEYEAEKKARSAGVVDQLAAREKDLLGQVAAHGGTPKPAAGREEGALRASLKLLENQLGNLKAAKLSAQADAGRKIVEVGGLRLAAQRLDGADPKSLRGLADKVKAELGSGLIFLAAPGNGKLSFVLVATPDLGAKGVDAAKIAKAFAAANGGSAGGRADFAQGGAADGDWDALVESLAGCVR